MCLEALESRWALSAVLQVKLSTTDLDGNPIASVALGRDFLLKATVQDVLPQPEGVFAAFVDVTYDGAKVAVDGPLSYGNSFPGASGGNTDTAGLLDEVGAVADFFSHSGGAELTLFTIPLKAAAAGQVDFLLDPADLMPAHTSYVFLKTAPFSHAVAADEFSFIPASITIGEPANAAPSFVKGDDQAATDESGAVSIPGWATAISPGPPAEAAQGLKFTVTPDSPNLFSVQPAIDAEGNLTFTPAANASGTAQLTVSLQDDGGTANGGVDTSSPQTFAITISKPHAWHNTLHGLDVNGDNHVVAGDALLIINYLNAFGSGPAPAQAPPDGSYLDTAGGPDGHGDGFVAPGDALAVINYLNAFGTGGAGPAGEGEWTLESLLPADDALPEPASWSWKPQSVRYDGDRAVAIHPTLADDFYRQFGGGPETLERAE